MPKAAQNISLEKASQSTFENAIKNFKELMKQNEETEKKGKNKTVVPTVKTVLGRTKKIKRPGKFRGRGVVYLAHIPKGFYEDEMMSYFNQFGRVTRLNLVRSKKSGNPKGYAFIEFLYSEVAQVVAETMNNYLMFGKVLKAEYIPGDQVRHGMFAFSKIRPDNCPRTKARDKWIEKTNQQLKDEEVLEMAVHELKRINKIKEQMKNHGIEFNCQVDGGSITVLKTTDAVRVVELDRTSIEMEDEPPPKKMKKQSRKRSQSTSTAPEKKRRMTLLQGLKSKKDSTEKSKKSFMGTQSKIPIVRLKRLEMFTKNFKKQKNSKRRNNKKS